MVYNVNVFSNLRKMYSDWDSLRAFLESEAGGSIRVIEDPVSPYMILRYVKGQSDLTSPDKPWVPWMRSVVWNTLTNLPVCVAPRKAMGSEVDRGDYEVEEFVEGVMVNGFTDSAMNMTWATRSSLGAKTGFYSTKPFAEMIRDAEAARSYHGKDLAGTMLMGGWTFASFVLQHPEHRVVQKIEKPAMYMIHMGIVGADGIVSISESPVDWPEPLRSWAVKKYKSVTSEVLPMRLLDQISQNADTDWQGLVFRGTNGERWRVRTLTYKILRELRGKESRIEDRFCRLRQQSMIHLYTKNWTEETQAFFDLEKRFRALTVKLYEEYCAVHKEKSKRFMDVEIPLRTHIYTLHGIYLNELRPKNMTLRMGAVIQYVNALPIDQQSSLLRSNVELDASAV